jgi:glycerophosphoryl diester phosphodiesterase
MPPLSLPRIIGHRGARASAPENTLAGIRQARREGATWVEFDVKLTADGHAVLMHDDTLDRTTDGAGPVRAATLSEIRTLDAGARFGDAWRGEPVPTLREALHLLATLDMGFNLEIKPCAGREDETARVAAGDVAAFWSRERPTPIVSSFSPISLAAARATAPQLAFGYLVTELPADWQSEAAALGCAAVHVGWRKLSRDQVQAIKHAGYAAVVWTVNRRPRARELVAWGADAVISDRPALMAGL